MDEEKEIPTRQLYCKTLIFKKSNSQALVPNLDIQRLFLATSMHWITWSFSRKLGMASTMIAVLLGRASIN